MIKDKNALNLSGGTSSYPSEILIRKLPKSTSRVDQFFL